MRRARPHLEMTDAHVITRVESMVVEIPMKAPTHGVHGTVSTQRSALVRVVSDQGAEGWGNVDPTVGYSASSVDDVVATVRRLAPALKGADALNAHRALALMDREVAEGFEAKAAVEMALFDLAGRVLGVPVTTLLGGRVRDEVRFNAWIGTVPPAQAAREAEAWAARGFRSAKIKVDGATDEGVARVAAVREAVGDRLALRVDFNESLRLGEAAAFIRRLEPFALTLVEQPIARDQIAGLAEIRRGIGIPLMADESVTDGASLIDIIRRGAADLVKVKVMTQGGFLRTRAMIECAAVAAISEAVIDGCEAVGPLKMAADVVTEPVRLDTGVLRLSDRPGLAATVDLALVQRYRSDG